MSCPDHRWFRPDCPGCQAAAAPDVVGGLFFGQTDDGRFVALGPTAPANQPVDVWMCRRVADFAGGRVPAGGQVAACDACGASIVFSPARQVEAPKRCMQCCDVRPLSITDGS